MKVEKKLVLIAAVAFIATMGIFFTQKNQGNKGIFNTIFEIALMTGLIFLIIAINFFAIAFIVKKLKEFFSK